MKLNVVIAALLRLPFHGGAAFTAGSSAVRLRQGPYSCFDRLPVVVVTAVGDVDANGDENRTEGTVATPTTRCNLGLLHGVDPTVDDFYANEIDMSKKGLAWLETPGLMWEAAKKDALELNVTVKNYVRSVNANILSFRKSGIVYDREELLVNLEGAFMDEGSLTLLLGGKNVGKSTVLKFLVKNYHTAYESKQRESVSLGKRKFWAPLASAIGFIGKRLIARPSTPMDLKGAGENPSKLLFLYVDARVSPGRLDVGLANAIAQLAAETLTRTPETEDWVDVVGKAIYVGSEFVADTLLSRIEGADSLKARLKEVLDVIAKSVIPKSEDKATVSKGLLDIFVKIAKDRNAFPVLVIDEANVVLGIKTDSGKRDEQTNNLLTTMASYTKQNAKMNVIMASSEHGYPYRLEQEGFNLENVDCTIFAGEIPPTAMWKLLVSARYEEGDSKGKRIIGMGPHLAELCLAAYGGHFWNVRRAIKNLSTKQNRSVASSSLPNLFGKINKCLNTNPMSRPLLVEMAKIGLAPLADAENPAAELISKQNVGGVITKTAVCCGMSEDKWEGTDYQEALIPSSQCVRLRIAQVLLATAEPEFGP